MVSRHPSGRQKHIDLCTLVKVAFAILADLVTMCKWCDEILRYI